MWLGSSSLPAPVLVTAGIEDFTKFIDFINRENQKLDKAQTDYESKVEEMRNKTVQSAKEFVKTRKAYADMDTMPMTST